MTQRQTVEAALAGWRDAERRLALAADGEADVLTRDVATNRDEYQRLSAANMADWMAKLDDAEERRSNATPSTPPFHEAARDTQEIARSGKPRAAATRTRPKPSTSGRRPGQRRPESAEPRQMRPICKVECA